MSCADLTWFKILRGFVGAHLSCALMLLRAFVCAVLSARFCLARFCYGANRVHQNVSLYISFLIFYGSLIGCIILLPQEVVL